MSEKASNRQSPQQQSPQQPHGQGQKQQQTKRQGQPQQPSRAPSNARVQMDLPHKRKQATKKQIVQLKVSTKEVALFSHLPQFEKPASVSLMAKSGESIHPAIVTVGLKYSERIITGSNARVMAMLDAFIAFIKDYKTPHSKVLALDLDNQLKPLIQFIEDCRPMSIGMRNAVKVVRGAIGRTTVMPEAEAKEHVLAVIDEYKKQKILDADKVICDKVIAEKIVNGDVILTYGSSYIVQRILTVAHEKGINFRVIIVDSNPKFEGRTLLERLNAAGIDCTYLLLTGLSYVVKDATKFLMGAHGLLSNGAVVSRAGSAVVAMMAHYNHIPVLVCCETHKFYERVQLDAICNNELEDAESLLRDGTSMAGWKENEKLRVLNLAYDLTPMEYVSAVVTEVGLVPTTSIPAILREDDFKKNLE
eukprot:TRINITY_DN9115_c0_g1_i1.p1 TRINITY_DN9115_c0_g1~~TRINITY_DN9115_c0_g1_i1.p1  ORF type:complete len:435 (+),score=92.72 TRINITY_DN9115_c0_g1_i1:49-1305(+)